jgi:hypothetical protein
MQCNTRKINLVACQVWSKVKLFHTLFGSFLNHVRQALSALLKIKHILYYNTMQGSTQAHFFFVNLLRSSTLSSFLNWQNVASSSGFVKISANWSSVLTPSSDISFLATWSLRKWWQISMCLVRECWTGLLAIFTVLLLSHKRGTFLELHHSLEEFASCKGFVRNKHPR